MRGNPWAFQTSLEFSCEPAVNLSVPHTQKTLWVVSMRGMDGIDRNAGFDALRGVAILAVVGIHAAGAGYGWKGRPGGEANFWNTLLFEQFFNFAVPAFLFASGYFVAPGRSASSGADYRPFLRRRLTRILVPYCVWSVAVLSAFLVLGKISLLTAAFRLFTGEALRPYYFMLLICQCYLLTPVLMYLNKRRFGFHGVVLFNIALLAIMYVIHLGFSRATPRPLFAMPFYSWIAFYQYGLLMGANANLEQKVASRPRLFASLAAAGLLLSWIEAVIMIRYFDNVQYAATAIKLSSFVYSMGLISLFLWLKSRVQTWNQTVAAVGRNSFGIYLTHDIILVPVMRTLHTIRPLDAVQPLFQSTCVALTVCLCLSLVWLSRRIWGSNISTRVFGL
jgi:probable poly-beta-1,6-N-acetyl-D-glucosamine export protein